MPDLRERTIRLAYAKPEIRPQLLAALRPRQASCSVGVSWAWISPEGKSHRTTHGGHAGWAREYFQANRPDEWAEMSEDRPISDASAEAYRKLLDEGWIRVASVRDVYVHNPAKITQRAWHAMAEMMVQCIIDEQYDSATRSQLYNPERKTMWLEWSDGRRNMSPVEFLETYGPMGAVDSLFNRLLEIG